jgi:hypothetical protein
MPLKKDLAMSKGFIKLNRCEEIDELLAKEHDAFILLTIIAMRCKRTSCFSSQNLKPGEALIGDYENYGMTEQRYRTSKLKLEKWKFATFRSTNKGTIANLVDSTLWDVNLENDTNKITNKKTLDQRPANDQLTTNKKDKKERREKGVSKSVDFSTPPPTPQRGNGGGAGKRKEAFKYEGTISSTAIAAHKKTLKFAMTISSDKFQEWLDDFGLEAVRLELEATIKEKCDGKKISHPARYVGARLANNHTPKHNQEGKIHDINSVIA